MDLVMLGVKAWQVKEIRDQLAKVIQENATVLPLQNGVLAAEELTEVLDPHRVMGGLCRIISMIERPGVIKHFGAQPNIVLGELSGEISIRSTEITELIRSAGIHTNKAENIRVDLWKKFIFICVGGLEAASRTTNGR